MPRVPVICRWLLDLCAPVVPRHLREDWRREWDGELWHFIDARVGARDREAYRIAISHCLGAIADAVYLRRNDEESRAAVFTLIRRPSFYFLPIAFALLVLAALSTGFENTRRMIRPLPYRAPEQVVVVRQVNPFMGARLGLPLGKIPGWRKAETLDGVAAYAGFRALVEERGVREVDAAAVDPEFFKVLGVHAQSGQLFHEAGAQSCDPCAVVSYELWQSALAGDPRAVGRTYRIAGRPHTVIGILPPGFWFFSDSPAVWTLIPQTAFLRSDFVLVYAIARRKPGFTDDANLTELRRLYRTLPPTILARQMEERSIASLVQDPFYRTLPIVFTGLVVAALAAVATAGNRRPKLRARSFFVLKVSAAALTAALAAVEFAYAPGMRMTGVRGFGPEMVSFWLLIFGFGVAVWCAVDDQRKRCPACLQRLSMPVQMGGRGHILMGCMSTELVCPNGHGLLWAPEDSLESHPKDRWLDLDESWADLFEVPHKH